jgi:hypothetical protein
MVNKLRNEGMSRQGGVESTHQSVYVCFASDNGGPDGMRASRGQQQRRTADCKKGRCDVGRGRCGIIKLSLRKGVRARMLDRC